MTNTVIRGNPSIGLRNRRQQLPSLPLPEFSESADDAYVRLTQRLTNLETLVERKADKGSLRSEIAISPEAIKLQARDVVVQGAFSVVDIINDQNGTASGKVPARITQVIGDKIRTGIIVSNNLSTTAGTSLNLNTGEIIVGGTDSPKLYFDPDEGDLTISGQLTADSLVLTKNKTLGQISDIADGALPAGDFDDSLQYALNLGVNNIIAGMSGDFRLDVGTSSIIAKHKDANEAGLGAGYAGAIRTGLILTANGIGMGYNRTSDGAWVNAISIGSTGDVNVLGTLTAGSVITGSVTVDGVALSTVSSNASTGAGHAGTTGNPHSTSLSQVTGDLDDIADGSTYFRTTWSDVAGGGRAYQALDSSYNYVRGLSTQRIVVSESNPTNGVVLDSSGLRGYSGGALKFNIDTSGNASFSGDISGANGTFSGNIVTSGQVKATGTTSSSEGSGTIVGESSTSGVIGVIGVATNTTGVVGVSGTGVGVLARSSSTTQGAIECSNISGGPAISAVGSIRMTSISGNVTIGGVTETGQNNLIIKEGASGSRIAGQIALYGQSDSGDAVVGILTENTVTAGTGAFVGINQVKVYWNNTAYWLPLQAA